MKKFISIIATAAMIIPTAATIVACAPQTTTNVLFILPELSMSQNSRITRSYLQIANEFNNQELNDSNVKIEVRWESGDSLQQRANSGQQLPDLYIAYPDVVSRYLYDVNQQNNVRDMEATYWGDEDRDDEGLKAQFWSESFFHEGVIGDDSLLAVLPLNKSFDMTVLNLQIFLELASLVDVDLALQIQAGLKAEGHSGNMSTLFTLDENVLEPELIEALIPGLTTIANAQSKETAIRDFFKLNANVLNLATVYQRYYNGHLASNIETKYTNNPGRMYSLGIEGGPNRIFAEYADAMQQQGAIDPMTSPNFFYNVKNIQPERQSMEVEIDNQASPIFQGIAEYFNAMGALRNPDNLGNGDPTLRWGGSWMLGRLDNRTYTSDYFNQGTMLLTSSSTAGSWSYRADREQFDRNSDLLTISSSTKNGNYFNFIQQGPGLAGFKSIGRNANEKEAVVTKFVQYLLKPQVLNRLAIMSGYIPSTTEALNFFQHYKNGDYNNQTGEWTIENTPTNAADYEQIAEVGSVDNYATQFDTLIAQLLANYALTDNGVNMNVVSTNGNPAGALIRTAIDNALKNYLFNDSVFDLNRLLGTNRADRGTLIAQFAASLPGNFSNSTIRVKQ